LSEKIAATVLAEAAALVSGPRNEGYGNAIEDFGATAAIWTIYLHRRGLVPLDKSLEPRDVGLLMVGLKLSREAHVHGRDNCVDGAGYFALAEEVHTSR